MFEEHNDFEIYCADVRRYILPHEQQLVLFERFKNEGDTEARKRFVEAQLFWVAQVIARSYRASGVMMDLIQDANLQLLSLVETYNPATAKFQTYAEQPIVRTAATNFARYGQTRSVAINALKASKRVRDKFEACMREGMNSEDALREAAAFYVEFSRKEVFKELPPDRQEAAVQCALGLLSLSRTELSLDKPIGDDDDDGTFGDTIGDSTFNPESQAMKSEVIRYLAEVIQTKLNKNQRLVLVRSKGLFGYTVLKASELADLLGVSRQRINKILNDAIKIARTHMRAKFGEGIDFFDDDDDDDE